MNGESSMRHRQPIEILLVEDSPGDVRLMVEALKMTQIPSRLNVARDGVEAMQYLRHEGEFAGSANPDLILLDLNMPRKSGREVLAEMKVDAKLRGIPVVVLTTSDAERDVLESYELLANCFVTKPVDLDRFLDVINTIQEFWLQTAQLPTMRTLWEQKTQIP